MEQEKPNDTPEDDADQVPAAEVAEAASAEVNSDRSSIEDLGMIMNIPVTLSMEIGQTRISIDELLKLGKDSVVELQRMADEPMDILVNGTLIAHGEAVVVDGRFGVRLIDVINPQERLAKLN